MKERIQKIIANCGYCSRRAAEVLIERGLVVVNDKVATIGQSADVSKDKIVVEGTPLKIPTKQYFILNKPAGYETTLNSPQGRRTVFSLVKTKERIIPVGRLDMNSSGLLLLTNDGEFANRIMHPRYELEKEYEATVKGKIPLSKIKMLERGVDIRIAKTSPCKVKILKETKKFMRVSIVIHEGKNRQIRRMFQKIGYNVEDLKRKRIGFLTLHGLKEGKSRRLTKTEISNLKKALKMS